MEVLGQYAIIISVRKSSEEYWGGADMSVRQINKEVSLVRWYPDYDTALMWYQDAELCRQVDGRDGVYDMEKLKRMYQYLNQKGWLFYIKYKEELCGDVCLQYSGEVNIVISKPYQNKHIGRSVISEMIRIAREHDIRELYAEIYDFNHQSQKMFKSAGFEKTEGNKYILVL